MMREAREVVGEQSTQSLCAEKQWDFFLCVHWGSVDSWHGSGVRAWGDECGAETVALLTQA